MVGVLRYANLCCIVTSTLIAQHSYYLWRYFILLGNCIQAQRYDYVSWIEKWLQIKIPKRKMVCKDNNNRITVGDGCCVMGRKRMQKKVLRFAIVVEWILVFCRILTMKVSTTLFTNTTSVPPLLPWMCLHATSRRWLAPLLRKAQ